MIAINDYKIRATASVEDEYAILPDLPERDILINRRITELVIFDTENQPACDYGILVEFANMYSSTTDVPTRMRILAIVVIVTGNKLHTMIKECSKNGWISELSPILRPLSRQIHSM